MKIRLRQILALFPVYAEIYISLIIMAAVVIGSIGLIKGLYEVYLYAKNVEYFQDFLSYALALIIAIELIRMLIRHTPGSIIEVLLFAMARKLIVTKEDILSLLWGIIGIAILFIIRKYFFVSQINPRENTPPDTTAP